MTTPIQQGPAQSMWNPWGSTTNVWNTVNPEADGSVPWDVAQSLGLGPGAMYNNAPTGFAGSSSRLYANTGSDAFLNSALNRLQGTVNGTTLPFDEATKSNLLSRASDMNAAAEASNAQDVMAQAAAHGGSASDPATQAALRQLKSQRQQSNTQAAQDIGTKANQANFAAQENAANNLSSTRLNQAQVDPYYNGNPRVFTGTTWGPPGSAGATAGSASAGGTATGAPPTYTPPAGSAPAGIQNPSGTYYNPTAGTIPYNPKTQGAVDNNPDHYGWRAQWLAARNQYRTTGANQQAAGAYGWSGGTQNPYGR